MLPSCRLKGFSRSPATSTAEWWCSRCCICGGALLFERSCRCCPGNPVLGPRVLPHRCSAQTPAQALGPYLVAQPTLRSSPASSSGALPAEGAPAMGAGNHTAAVAIKFLGARPPML